MTKPHATGPRINHERRQKEQILHRAAKQEERRRHPKAPELEETPVTHLTPKVHRDPPNRPEPALIDDGYYVEPEPIEPRLPYFGWESMRHRWDQSDQRPMSSQTAWAIVLLCLAVWLAVAYAIAAPRSGPDSSPEATSGDASQAQAGAPQLASPTSVGVEEGSSEVGSDAPYPEPSRLAISGASTPRAGFTVPPPGALLAGPRYSAQATWCAPTATKCQSWGDDARLAAVHSFTFGDAPYWVRVWRGNDHSDALVVSHCRCQDRDDRIDLSVAAFRQLAPTRLGRIDVEVEVLNWPYEPGGDPPPHPGDDRMREEDGATLPPTDTE